ncbi:lipopolysaccharide assembly protein B [Sideroxyarcus emersonii]|uniref:protein O-GlcNAc transferase n=1 Tax=Sideroxyarcus emersonii TaxID=2764705 RepID=A0AAN1X8G4_9PROT|nr:tetratricopeptide repeat protein [Sideroxyarcus emersonii]BCK86730.1 lipopolysaccharide assembly protein B [Sideroxyarcus emersonii]
MQAIGQALRQAIAHHQAGELQEAEKCYRAILQSDSHHPKANHNLGALYVQLQQPVAALPFFGAALEADPAHGQYWLSYIDALHQAGQPETARQVLALAKQSGLQGEDVDRLAALLETDTPLDESCQAGPSELQRQARPAAMPVEKPAVKPAGKTEGNPAQEEIDALMALFTQGRSAEAATLAQAMVQQFPLYGFGWKVLGAAFKQQGKSAEALAPMQKAAELLPHDAEAYSNLGGNLQDLGRTDEAVANLNRALQINPKNADAHLNLGVTLQTLGRLEEAEKSYRRALEIKPDFAAAHGNLGVVLQSMGRLPEALAHIQERARLMPGNAVDQHLIASLTGENTERAPIRYVEDVFDSYADSFDTHLQQALHYDAPGKLAQLISRHLPPEAKCDILDLGCGTGLVGAAFAPFARSLVGVDLSSRMLERARARDLYQRLVLSDLLPMMQAEPASSFDVIATADVFIYLGKLDDVIAEVKRLLRPGGLFAFSVEDCEVQPGSDIQGDGPDYQLKNTGRYGQSVKYLERLASANGLLVKEMRATEIRTEHGKPIKGHIGLWMKPKAEVISPTPDQLLQQAVAFHQEGKLEEAGRLYREILKIVPDHPEANHNLGVLAVQSNLPADGLLHFVAALEADPARRQYWLSYIDALFSAGLVEAAKQVLELAKEHGLAGEEVKMLAARLEADAQTAEHASEVPLPATKQTQGNSSAVPKTPQRELKAELVRSTGKSSSQQPADPGSQEINALMASFAAGRFTETEILARTMVERFPYYGFGWKALGTVLQQMGRNAEAVDPLQVAATLSLNDPEAHSNLGIALQDMGRLNEAEASFRKALQIDAEYADAYCNLGSALQEMGRLDEALTCFRRALQINPNLSEAHYNLGNTFRAMGRLAEAAESYRDALRIRKSFAQAMCNLGAVLNDLGCPDEAEKTLRQALEIKPGQAEVHSNLGNVLKELGRLNEAEASYRQALALAPRLAEIHNNLGNLLQDMGRLDEAETSYRQAVELKPDYDKAHSNLLFLLNYNPKVAPSFAFEEACRFGRKVAGRVTSPFEEWSCASASTRLRIGFVSGDFRNHPVGYFLESLLKNLDPASFELVAYPSDPWVDDLTERIKPYFDVWKPLYGMNDETAARLIHGDGIHILIDLSGHSRYNRLPVFAWKPAPVQVSWLGYFATTGVAEIEYLIADPHTLPETEERYFTEKIWRLPETRLCFTPPDIEMDVSPLPALGNGYVTFGCFNNLAKMNDDVVALWSRVLATVPDSRLFLKSKQLGEDSVRQKTAERFAAHGIDQGRLILEGAESRAKYFAAYHRVDIALDPFPYPGGTTTVESLWMGVPVLTLAGQSFLFRQGAGFLSNAGLPEWIAGTQDGYVEKAEEHAKDPQGLAALRSRLRQQMESSPIMDGQRFATHFAAALQAMWRERSSGKRP